jgi:hypothetical protein
MGSFALSLMIPLDFNVVRRRVTIKQMRGGSRVDAALTAFAVALVVLMAHEQLNADPQAAPLAPAATHRSSEHPPKGLYFYRKRYAITPVPPPTPQPTAFDACDGGNCMIGWCESNKGGQRRLRVRGMASGPLHGQLFYAESSDPRVGAVHQGLVLPGKEAVVLARCVSGKKKYRGVTSHGVTSTAYGASPHSFTLMLVQAIS